VEVAEDQDRAVGALGQGIFTGALQVHLPDDGLDPGPAGRGPGHGQAVGGAVGQDHRKPARSQVEPVRARAAGQVQDRAGQRRRQEMGEAHQERRRGGHVRPGIEGFLGCDHLPLSPLS